ncbi:MAG TPA: hypothetical protein VHS31_01005 [Tepidisphaeraceae bacterium]|jgi:hypothetical protein|nr:hypothetical protein [Tepidisphaeraceae bacterium]
MKAKGNLRGSISFEGLESREMFSAAHPVQVKSAALRPVSPVVIPVKQSPPPGGKNSILIYTGNYFTPTASERMTMYLAHSSDGGLAGTFTMYITNNHTHRTAQIIGKVHYGANGQMTTNDFGKTGITLSGAAAPDWKSLTGGYFQPSGNPEVPGLGIPFSMQCAVITG